MPNPVLINWWAMLVAVASGFVLGGLWYGPLFGKKWLAGVGMTEEEMKASNPMKAYLVTFVLGVLTAYVFAHTLSFYEAWSGEPMTWVKGMEGAFWVWLGYMFAVKFSDAMFSKTKISATIIDSGYRLVWMLIMGAIMGGWR